MLRFKAIYASRSVSIVMLLAAVGLLLSVAVGAVYTAIAAPIGIWRISKDNAEPAVSSASEPIQFRFREDVDPVAAVAMNAAVPDTQEPIVPALPFSIQSSSISARSKMLAIECLTAAIYYEADSESVTGQRAVAQVVLNRVRHPEYANNVCGVVFQGSERTTGCQFSFTCDGSLARRPSQVGWARAQSIAARALAGYVEPSVGLATHYHTIWVVPYWSSSLSKLRTVGSHIFYRWSGRNGTLAAFRNRYSGIEQLPQANLASTITAVDDAAKDSAMVADTAPAMELARPVVTEARDSKGETGLLVIPQARIIADHQSKKEKVGMANGNGLIVDKDRLGIRANDPSLMIDRR
jgi:Cell Wall Hydrolase